MTRTDWGLLVVLSVLWGGSFFFARIAVEGSPPLTLVFFRFAAAAVLVWAWLLFHGQPVPRRPRVWAAFAGMGLLNNLIPAGLIAWGQTMIPSGRASVLIATTPIWSITATRLSGVVARISTGMALGISLGLAGTAAVCSVDGAEASMPGMVACLGAAISHGCANALGHRFRQLAVEPVVTAFGQMAAASIITLPLMVAFDAPWRLPIPNLDVWVSMAGLVVLSTAMGYAIFFRILSRAGATNVSLVTLLIPVSAVLLGVAVLGELSMAQMAGMLLIGLGLLAIDGRILRIARVPAGLPRSSSTRRLRYKPGSRPDV